MSIPILIRASPVDTRAPQAFFGNLSFLQQLQMGILFLSDSYCLPQASSVEWPPELRPVTQVTQVTRTMTAAKKLCLPRLWKWISTRTNLQVGNIIQNDQSHISHKWKSRLYTCDYIVSTLANSDTYLIYSSQICIEVIFASKLATTFGAMKLSAPSVTPTPWSWSCVQCSTSGR